MINSDKIIKILNIILGNLNEDKIDFLRKNGEEIIELKKIALSLMDAHDKHRVEHKKIFEYVQELQVKILNNELANASSLIKEIIKMENELENEEKEKYLTFAKECWHEFNETYILYHGTTSAYVENIKKYGLDFDKFPINLKDLIEFNELIKKTGEQEPLALIESYSNKRIHLSHEKRYSIGYANQGGEILNNIVAIGNLVIAKKSILKLKSNEQEKVKRIHDIAMNIIRQGKPVIIHILAKCPNIINAKTKKRYMEEFSDFSEFEKKYNKIISGSYNVSQFIDQMREYHNYDAIAGKIEKEYIVKIEPV